MPHCNASQEPKVVNYVLNRGSVIVATQDETKVYAAGSEEYDKVKEFILSNDEVGLWKYVNAFKKVVEKYKGFRVENDVVFVNDEALPAALGKRLKGFADEGADYNYLLKFWENLKLNPSFNSVNNLFDFLERVHCPITKDGLIQCYKTVKNDYWDKYTGKTFHSVPGAVISVPRGAVDDNREAQCSFGAHVGGLTYIHWYGRKDSGDRIMEVFVNPKDFVAVPTDHDFHKARVCEYTVGKEVGWDEVAPTKQTYVRPEDIEDNDEDDDDWNNDYDYDEDDDDIEDDDLDDDDEEEDWECTDPVCSICRR